MSRPDGLVALSKTSDHLARIEQDILGLPTAEFEALAEWFTMVLTLRRAVEVVRPAAGAQLGGGGESAAEGASADPGQTSEAAQAHSDAEFPEPSGAAAAASTAASTAEDRRWEAADSLDEVEAAAPEASELKRRGTRIRNRRFSSSELPGTGSGGAPERTEDGEGVAGSAGPQAAARSDPAPTAEGRALLALCGGGCSFADEAEGRQALQALCGMWGDGNGSLYDVSPCYPGDRLNVRTRRPNRGKALFTKGLIRLQNRPDANGMRITWGAKASFVLVTPLPSDAERFDVVQWASPDNYRKPFEWTRCPKSSSMAEAYREGQ